jgi:ATP adenylyltransferase
MSLYNFAAARSDEQLKDMQNLDSRGVCIFCPEHIGEDKQELLIDTDSWMVKENSYPYKDTKLHLLLVPKEHVSTISKLSLAAQKEFLPLVSKCERKFKLTSYALAIRSGDMRRNGGSIEHLHVHIVVGNTDNPDHEPVRFKMSSRPN